MALRDNPKMQTLYHISTSCLFAVFALVGGGCQESERGFAGACIVFFANLHR